ncbi:MAG: acyltransferase family protein, partial [Verrucomicrobiota bacterium]
MSGTQNDKRLDIQLLRAVSVLAVIWYHLDPKSLGGGYLGVDVFFVISGYLITRIFLKSEGKFSIKAFYKRRVCRLFPALLGVLLIVFAYTVLVMQPVAFLESIRSLAYSGLQIANFYFIQGTGYFEGSHDNSPLLHCWSLGVEEQFYLFWAPFYLLLWNKCKNSSPRLWVVVLWIAIGSLAIDIALKLIEPKAAFYLPLPRAWELLLGAILALTEKNNSARRSPLFWWIGVSVILISLFFGKSEGMLDLVSRLFACTGAAICLRHRNLLKSKLWRPWTYIGDISYSLYLWHWPIICLAGLHGVFADQWQTILILIGASLFMGVVSFHGIEEVWRKRQSKGLLRFWLAAMIAITAAALFLEGSKNATWRVSPSFETENYVRPESIRNVDELRREGITIEQALLPETTQRQVALLVGDSHAGHFLPLVETWAEATGHQLELYQQGASLSFSENIRSIEIDPDGTVAKNLSFADRAQYLRSYINEA